MRVKLNFQGNGYASTLIDRIYEGYSARTYINSHDLMAIRTQSWDYPIKVEFFRTSLGLFARLQTGSVSLSFTTQLIEENRPSGTLRFEQKLSTYKIIFVDQTIRQSYLPSIALITEDGFYLAADE